MSKINIFIVKKSMNLKQWSDKVWLHTYINPNTTIRDIKKLIKQNITENKSFFGSSINKSNMEQLKTNDFILIKQNNNKPDVVLTDRRRIGSFVPYGLRKRPFILKIAFDIHSIHHVQKNGIPLI